MTHRLLHRASTPTDCANQREAEAFASGLHGFKLAEVIQPLLRQYLDGLLRRNTKAGRWNLSRAARESGVHRNTLYRWIADLQLEPRVSSTSVQPTDPHERAVGNGRSNRTDDLDARAGNAPNTRKGIPT